MQNVLDYIAQIGGISVVIIAIVTFVFREYIKNKITDLFTVRIERRAQEREDSFLLTSVKTQVRAEVIKELVSARLKAIEQINEHLWTLSDNTSTYSAALQVANSSAQPFAVTVLDSFNALYASINRFSSIISFSAPYLPEDTEDLARQYYYATLQFAKRYGTPSTPPQSTDLQPMWDLDIKLRKSLKDAVTSTITMPDIIKLQSEIAQHMPPVQPRSGAH